MSNEAFEEQEAKRKKKREEEQKSMAQKLREKFKVKKFKGLKMKSFKGKPQMPEFKGLKKFGRNE